MAPRALTVGAVARGPLAARATRETSGCREAVAKQVLPRNSNDRVPRGRIYVRPGDLVVSSEPDVLFTVLGSCVSVCLWDAESRVAGMNHFVFPGRPGEPSQRGPRFGADAVHGLLERSHGAGADPRRMVAKVFGGARIPQVHAGSNSISDQNVTVATQLLRERGVRIVASDLGGSRGRKVVFDTGTGDVWMKYLVDSNDDGA